MSARVCMCGECWIGSDATWAEVERDLALAGFAAQDIRRVIAVLDDGWLPMRADRRASPCSSKVELMIFKEEAPVRWNGPSLDCNGRLRPGATARQARGVRTIMNEAAEKVVALKPVETPRVSAAVAPLNMDELRERVRAFKEAEDLSQATMAKEIGLSSSVVSQWLAGEYLGKNDNIAAKVVLWLNRRAETRKIEAVMPAAPAWIETPTARKIYDKLAFAHSAPTIAVIYGGAGLSKTTTIRRYRDRSTNVWVVTASPPTANHSALLEEIAIAMGLRDFPLHAPKLLRAIIASMHGTKGMLVLDEAQHLTKQALETARSIYDKLEGTIGLAFSGNASVYGKMYGGGTNGFAQLFSRVGTRLALGRPTAGDVHAFAAGYGIKGNDERRELEEIAQRPGALRMVLMTIRLASVFAAGAPVRVPHIRSAYEDLQGQFLSAEEVQP